MKKILLVSAVAALTVFGCKNNPTTRNTEIVTDTVKTETVRNGEIETEGYTPQITEPVAFRVWKLLVDDGKDYVCPENCTLTYSPGDLSQAEGYMINETVYCYPAKDGSFLAILEHVEAAEGQGGEYLYNFYNYKDGNLTKAENDIPVPAFLEMVVEPDERRGQDDILALLENLYKENPCGILQYIFFPEEGVVKMQLHPLSYSAYVEPDENGKYRWLEQFWEMRKDFSNIVYRWDGEKFVKSE